MKFFIDTANIDEIKKAVAMGMVDGVTTNPSLIMKSGRDIKEVTKEICDMVAGRDLERLDDSLRILPTIAPGSKDPAHIDLRQTRTACGPDCQHQPGKRR